MTAPHPPATVGERIAAARRAAGMSGQTLADRINCSVSTVRKVEQGHRGASPWFVAAAAEVFGVTVDQLAEDPR